MASPNQRTVHLDDDMMKAVPEFQKLYPLLPWSMIVNAALRYYFEHVKEAGGIDGNLLPIAPLKVGNTRR